MKKVRRAADDAVGMGAFLKDVRRARGLSLRAVEKATGGGVSNGYLSQLENGTIANPSATMLHKLAEAYALDYNTLLAHGGMAMSTATASDVAADGGSGQIATSRTQELFGDLTQEEERQLLQYLAFLRR